MHAAAAAAPSSSVVRAVYRAIIREAKRVAPIHVIDPPLLSGLTKVYGRGGFVTHDAFRQLQAGIFPPPLNHVVARAGLAQKTEWSPSDILRAIRTSFRGSGGEESGRSLDTAFIALQALTAQHALQACSSSTVTAPEKRVGAGTEVRVDVVTSFIPGLPPEACAAASMWPFTYRIRVRNTGTAVVQLLGRHWVFEDAKGGTTVVPKFSPGVVGHEPVLEAGAVFEYWSGTQLKTPTGTMKGSFKMLVPSTGETFEAAIRTTHLRAPEGGSKG